MQEPLQQQQQQEEEAARISARTPTDRPRSDPQLRSSWAIFACLPNFGPRRARTIKHLTNLTSRAEACVGGDKFNFTVSRCDRASLLNERRGKRERELILVALGGRLAGFRCEGC